MTGGAGDDTYIVDDFGDVVIEGVNSGTDVVRTSLSSYDLTDNVEELVFTGSAVLSVPVMPLQIPSRAVLVTTICLVWAVTTSCLVVSGMTSSMAEMALITCKVVLATMS